MFGVNDQLPFLDFQDSVVAGCIVNRAAGAARPVVIVVGQVVYRFKAGFFLAGGKTENGKERKQTGGLQQGHGSQFFAAESNKVIFEKRLPAKIVFTVLAR